jgi:hypothetical protein
MSVISLHANMEHSSSSAEVEFVLSLYMECRTIILHEMDNDKYYVFWSLAVPRHVLARWSTANTQDLSVINTLIIEWHAEDNPLVKTFTW